MKRTAPNANFYDYQYYSISHLKFHRQFCSEPSPVTLRVTANVAPEDHRNTDLLKIARVTGLAVTEKVLGVVALVYQPPVGPPRVHFHAHIERVL